MVDRAEGVSQSQMRSQIRKAEQHKHEQLQEAMQAASQASVEDAMETDIYNPLEQQKKFKELAERSGAPETSEAEEEGESQESAASQKAQEVQKKNPELTAKTLLVVRENIGEKDSTDDILGKLSKAFPDPSLADEALDYLIDTAGDNKTLKKNLETAKEQFNNEFGREIRAGRNIHNEAQSFSKQGLGDPTALRDLYRDVTGNPRTPNTLFEELSAKFTFKDMVKVLSFMLHSLGSDMKSKGPSIDMPELQRLFTETRTMQAILGVYHFFRGRMGLIKGEFARNDLSMPGQINFEQLAKVFMKFIQDRYPSVAKVFALAKLLGLDEDADAQIIIYMQYRDAMRNTSPRLFQGEKHRQGLLMTFIEALSELEDLEEEDDEDEEDEEKKDQYEDTLE